MVRNELPSESWITILFVVLMYYDVDVDVDGRYISLVFNSLLVFFEAVTLLPTDRRTYLVCPF